MFAARKRRNRRDFSLVILTKTVEAPGGKMEREEKCYEIVKKEYGLYSPAAAARKMRVDGGGKS